MPWSSFTCNIVRSNKFRSVTSFNCFALLLVLAFLVAQRDFQLLGALL